MAAAGGAAAGPRIGQGMQQCGVGISFTQEESGDIKISGIMPGSPASFSDTLQVGDVIVKVDGTALVGKTQQEIVNMVVGPPGTSVQLTVQTKYGYPHVMTAPFQVLPFDQSQKQTKKKRSFFSRSAKSLGAKGGLEDFTQPQNKLYGGGTLPPGFEHLEDLRSAQPYTTPSLSIRTVNLT
eukprot:CAMPEP_0114113004 /NCGR_PEP_ID=MMETSP0043_2-20121206/2682_1 /TAXON_ID=464988 /ORGANISM="Hemiselmis andersenii, Strain CCMP644" /LENGTH=180 /DNA_ID=CAMNT_0001205127 /DNA_START=109 /DNA_END=647 /DNA_ORIENTATION=-